MGSERLAPPPVPQVFVALEGFKTAPPAAEADLAPVQTLINQAYQGVCWVLALLPPCFRAGTSAERNGTLLPPNAGF